MIAPNDGPNAALKTITVSYFQDCVPFAAPCPSSGSAANGTAIRDAGIEQITYGYQPHGGSLQITGSVDFKYLAPNATTGQSKWATTYGTNYHCTNPPKSTTLRCADPLDYSGGNPAPKVMSTLSLQSVTSYVGKDDGTGNTAYSYAFTYQDTPFAANGPWGGACADFTVNPSVPEYCAGNHLLTNVTPTVYTASGGHALKPTLFSYYPLNNTYSDHSNPVPGGLPYIQNATWQYLSAYLDTSSGVGAHIVYQRAYNNTHGTPNAPTDDRHDPLYCAIHAFDQYTCNTGVYQFPDDHAWTEQVVTSITAIGKDSSTITPATTTYAYRLKVTGNNCPAAGTDTDCVGDNWLPIDPGSNHKDSDWADFYHGEYHGFEDVSTVSPSNDLTVDAYITTEGWFTPAGHASNYNAGSLDEEDVYSGPAAVDNKLLRKTTYDYTGFTGHDSCDGNLNLTYVPCLVMFNHSITTLYEGTGSGNANAPWIRHDYTYDDYDLTNGLSVSKYHNLLQDVVSSANAPTLTRKSTYTTTDSTYTGTGWIFYDVNKVAQSEIDDTTGHKWQCQGFTYDEGAPSGAPNGTPGAGWPTKVSAYTTTNCTQPLGTPLITSYSGYDTLGNAVATVDGVAVANPGLYGSTGQAPKNGCTLSTAPAIFTSAWGKSNYTTCATYDSYNAQPASKTNAFGQQSSIQYDYTQGALPSSIQDVNSQVTTTLYSYDANSGSNNKRFVGVKQPGESGSYTSQSFTTSSCTTSSPDQVNNLLPCFEVDSQSSQYSSPYAISQTFYDSLGRAVQSSTPMPIPPGGASAAYYKVVLTSYSDDGSHSMWQSLPFVVGTNTAGPGWLDPKASTTKDYLGNVPKGTATFYDALGRPIAVLDPLFGQTGVPGISCPSLGSNATACTVYELDSPNGDTATYATTKTIDPNNHVAEQFQDALGNTRYTRTDSGVNGGTLTPNEQKNITYNVLNEPTQIVVQDLQPQTNQTITSVTTTATYDDLGRVTQLADPDRGTHTYTYDNDGHLLTDVSGTRTLGDNYDLLARLGCVQDALPTIHADGSCSSGNALVRNTYDVSAPGVTWSGTDYPIGRLTQSVAKTIYPQSTSATSTQSVQFDQRGRPSTQQLQLGLPSGWNVTTALPTEQQAISYNDANQQTVATTSTLNPTGSGYTQQQLYDLTSGVLTGLGDGSRVVVNLSYNASAQTDTLFFQTSTSTSLANEQFVYDGDLRPTSATATWQSGSGSSTSSQYLYCTAGTHQLDGLYPTGTTCSTKSGALYTSSYDAFGNVTSRVTGGATATLSYDALDHLSKWNSGANNEYSLYDAGGNRVLRRSINGGTTTITTYAFGAEEHTYSGTGTLQSNTYYYMLGGRLIGELIGSPSPLSTSIFLTDALGSVLATFNNTAGSAALLGNQVYSPYGTQRYTKGAMGTTKGFTGQYNDSLTGLDYYNARYYDPAAAVFLSVDTKQGNLQGMNPYDYVGGNPETKNDPTGQRYADNNGDYAYVTSDGNHGVNIYTFVNIYNSGTVWETYYHMNTRHLIDYANGFLRDYHKVVPHTDSNTTLFSQFVNGYNQLVGWVGAAWNHACAVMCLPSDPTQLCAMLSFTPTTQVATSKGAKAIGSLHPGERVWAYNPKTHKMELEPVVHVWINHDHDLVDVTITSTISPPRGKPSQKTSEVVHTNQKHPFLTVEKGFVPVSQLQIGMHVVNARGSVGTISMLKGVPGAMTMYNLEVAQDHTFTVGKGEWIVHNCADPTSGTYDGTSNNITMQDIINDPYLVENMTPEQVKQIAVQDGWVVGPLGKGSHAGSGPGWTFRQLNARGTAYNDNYIQWHPGGGHHGPEPYWKVSSGKGGTIQIGPQFPKPSTEGEPVDGEIIDGEIIVDP